MSDPYDPYRQSPQTSPYDTSNQYNPDYFQNQYPQPGNRSTRPRRWRASSCLGCLLSLALMFGLFFLIFLFATSLHLENLSLLYSQGDDPLTSPQLWLIGGCLWILGLLSLLVSRALFGGSKISPQRPVRSLAGKVFAVTFFAFFITALIWSGLINPNIGMTRTSFLRANVSITDNTSIHIRNPADGIAQILCTGVDQRCQPVDGAPAALNHGFVIQPGQTITLSFTLDKIYGITSKTTPGMNLTVTVNAPSDDSGGD